MRHPYNVHVNMCVCNIESQRF